jgi:hypothetical protein
MAKKTKMKKPENQQDQWQVPQKRTRGQGVFYDEPKSAKINLALTPTAKKMLIELAKSSKLSASEFMERWLRGSLDEQCVGFVYDRDSDSRTISVNR